MNDLGFDVIIASQVTNVYNEIVSDVLLKGIPDNEDSFWSELSEVFDSALEKYFQEKNPVDTLYDFMTKELQAILCYEKFRM